MDAGERLVAMVDALTPLPIGKPDIVVPDAAPLTHLSQAGLLDLLHDAGAAVVVVDIDVLTTRAFLERMQISRQDGGAPTYRSRVVANEPTMNPRIQSFSQRRPRP